MQTLSATLTAEQKLYSNPIYKVVFTATSQTTRGYSSNISNRIRKISRAESEWSQTADITLDNGDGTLTALTLAGYLATISYGYYTGVTRTAWAANTAYSVGDIRRPITANGYQYRCTVAGTSHATTEPTWGTTLGVAQTDGTVTWVMDGNSGDEYSDRAPLEVTVQEGDTLFRQGLLLMPFHAIGVFDMMGQDEASEERNKTDADTDTIKTLLTAAANATMACFSHTKSYTITFDSEDSLIDSFIPADYFRVSFKESRLSVFKRLLSWTKCKARIENTSNVATIHVFYPRITGSTWAATTAYVKGNFVQPTVVNDLTYECTTAGTSAGSQPTWPTTAGNTVTDGTVTWTCRDYHYEYDDAVSQHNFFEKSVRNRLVIPNRVYVASHPDHTTQYTGNATDSGSYDALGRYIDQYHWLRVTSNAQCTSIATAILQKYQVGQQKGHGVAPINCGQEVMDYIKITDSKASDSVTGNIGWMTILCEPGKFEFSFGFGAPELGGIASLLPSTTGIDVLSLNQTLSLIEDTLNKHANKINDMLDIQRAIILDITTLWNREEVDKWHVSGQLIIPVI